MLLLLLSCAQPKLPPNLPASTPGPEDTQIGDLAALGLGGWHTVLLTGQVVGGQRFGPEGESQPLDGASVLGGTWLINHFERSDGAIWRTRLDPQLQPVETAAIDMSRLPGGGYNHCAASTTPWGTHLGSEEYEPDAAIVGADQRLPDKADRGRGGPETIPHNGYNDTPAASPYDYGWMFEIEADGWRVNAHRAMGRFSHEQGVVLPDRRTVYLSDDTYLTRDTAEKVGGGVLFRFVADRAGDLSEGELFAAVLTEGRVSWVSLGHAADAELDGRPRFDELFDRVLAADCPPGFTRTETTTGRECLKVKAGQERRASRFESRRYAAMQGASAWLSKTEGMALDENTLYLVVSGVQPPMTGQNHGLPELEAGLILAFDLDATGAATAYRVEVGEGVNNADNIAFAPGVGLFIAEDSHKNPEERNNLWLWRGGKLERVVTSPKNMEVAGLNLVEVHQQRYLSVAFQGGAASSVSLIGPF